MLEIAFLLSTHPLQGDLNIRVQFSVVLRVLLGWDKVGGRLGRQRVN